MQRITLPRGAAALALAALAACSDAPTSTPLPAVAEGPQSELARQVEALGFRGDMVQDFGDYVLVEGDIRFTKAELAEGARRELKRAEGPRLQYRTTNLVGSPKVQQIVVDLSGLSSQTGWQNAARDAISHWSGISGSYVKMVEGSPGDITVSTNCTSSNVAAGASWPSGGNPGSTIHVNTCFGYSTTHSQKVHNMVHELGHTLGFRHSNYSQLGESAGTIGAVHISGTPTSGNASGSAMNGGTALNSWAGFSTSDGNATRALYPLPAPSGLTMTHPSGTEVLTWNAVPGASYYQIQYVEHRQENDYERGYNSWIYAGGWTTVYDTTIDTGSTWTGVSWCSWYNSMYTTDESNYYWEIRAQFPNGASYYVASVPAESATC